MWSTASGWIGLTTSDSYLECNSDGSGGSNIEGSYRYARKNTSGASPVYTNTSTSGLSWTTANGYPTVTLSSGNYLNFLSTAGANMTSLSKMDVAIQVVNNIVDANPNVRIGMMAFNSDSGTSWDHSSDPATDNTTNSGGRVTWAVQDNTAAQRPNLHTLISSYVDTTYTPLAETMYEAYLYLRGLAPRYGDSTSPAAPAKDASAQSGGLYISPITETCQKTYIILVTDGDPTHDENADALIDALPGIGTPDVVDAAAGASAGKSASSNHKSRLAVMTEWMYKNDLSSSLTGVQNAITHTIGFTATSGGGSGIGPEGLALLTEAATKAGGSFHAAADAVQLEAALQQTLINVQTESATFTSAAVSVNAFNTLFNRDEVYYTMFKPDIKRRWDGNIKKFTLCKNTAATGCKFGELLGADNQPATDSTTGEIKSDAYSLWQPNPAAPSVQDGNTVTKGGAGSKLPDSSTRTVYTYTGTYDAASIQPSSGSPVDLNSAANKISIANATTLDPFLAAGADRDKVINWVLGHDAFDENGDGNTTLDRSWRFYDPMHSHPSVVTYGGSSSAPVSKIFLGGNDGMLHMIDESSGVEEWAFVPQELLGQLRDVAISGQGDHIWGLDGDISVEVYDKNNNGKIESAQGDYVHIYFGMRRGGRNIYALDVTPPSGTVLATPGDAGPTPKLMWVIKGGTSTGYSALGQTWSRPIKTKIRTATGTGSGSAAQSQLTDVLIFAGGYDTSADPVAVFPAPTTSMGNSIYIANPKTGARIWWASNAGANLNLAKMVYAIPSEVNAMDSNGDGAVDRIYVGDIGGQVWRIDLAPELTTSGETGSGQVLANLACSNASCTSTSNQDRRRFYYPPQVAQVSDSTYSNVKDYDIVAIASGDREDPIDLHTSTIGETPVHNRLYALRDYTINALTTGGSITYPATILATDLYSATSDSLQGVTSTATITSSGIKSAKGWYISLKNSSGSWDGAKSLATTDIFNGILTATYFTPNGATVSSSACDASAQNTGGTGTAIAVSILDGEALFDLNGDGAITSADRTVGVGNGIPSEHVVIIRQDGNSDLVNTSSPGIVSGSEGNKKRYWYQ
jgi:type IV pilus assembly protein PilY1